MDVLINTIIAGTCYLIAGTCGLIRHFMLEPKIKELPRAPKWLLHVFFGFSVVLLFVGMRYTVIWATGQAVDIPPGVTGLGVVLAVSLLIYKVSLLKYTASKPYPKEVAYAKAHRCDTELL